MYSQCLKLRKTHFKHTCKPCFNPRCISKYVFHSMCSATVWCVSHLAVYNDPSHSAEIMFSVPRFKKDMLFVWFLEIVYVSDTFYLDLSCRSVECELHVNKSVI